ncbi:hypothetical protein [Paenibacillus sp. Marseille-Q4541]|uniref:putative amidoligase domain-containing protein n=1 Tax=Paenibacillus sp. Marseille-Q4541 TaxID=2831522 RepID=UPI001BA58134|nr:hypothetical protein [Paenibacillus sp. Marseille-Q4541]
MVQIRNLPLYERMSIEERSARLNRSGLGSTFSIHREHESDFKVCYEVLVSQLKALRIRKVEYAGIKQGKETSLLREDGSTLYKRIERAAVKAAYALNLEHAEVVLQSSDKGAIVTSVNDRPWLLNDSVHHMYEQGILETELALAAEKESGSVPVLGMDPEFLLLREDRSMVPASRFLDRQGEAGCDSITQGGRRIYPVAELRPSPSAEPRELMIHLMHAFQTASSLITDRSLIWCAGGMPIKGIPLGGHVHFSSVVLNFELLRALDNYLALPVAILEDPRSAGRRPRYGYLGDFRVQPYGGFEYRTLPSFLISPMIAKGVVAIAGLIASQYRNLTLRPLDQPEIHAAFYEGNRVKLRSVMEPLLQELILLPGYRKFHKYMNPLVSALYEGKTWDETRDIRPMWNIPSEP